MEVSSLVPLVFVVMWLGDGFHSFVLQVDLFLKFRQELFVLWMFQNEFFKILLAAMMPSKTCFLVD